jgi:hypothetical protein
MNRDRICNIAQRLVEGGLLPFFREAIGYLPSEEVDEMKSVLDELEGAVKEKNVTVVHMGTNSPEAPTPWCRSVHPALYPPEDLDYKIGGAYFLENRPKDAVWCPYCAVAYRIVDGKEYPHLDLVQDSYPEVKARWEKVIKRADETRSFKVK